MAYGMMAAEPGIDVLCLGEMGIANTTTAATLCAALFGGTRRRLGRTRHRRAGRGAGAQDRRHRRGAGAPSRRSSTQRDPLALLAAVGGEELAAIAGAVLAARMGRIPVLLDGYACTAAAAVLHAIDRHALDHCLVAHRSAEPGHTRLLEAIGQRPLLDFGMRLGEASAAALAVPLLKAAAACHNGMATFAQAGVSSKSSS